jgi:hypothetical protein
MTQAEKERVLREARQTVLGRLSDDETDALAAWNAGREARDEPDPESGVPARADSPKPAPGFDKRSAAANPDPGGWNAWFRANYDAAQAEQSQLSPFLTELLGDLIAHERRKFDKALAQEHRRFDLAIARLRTELCTHITDTLGRIERVISSERIVRGVEHEAADRRVAGEPDKLN